MNATADTLKVVSVPWMVVPVAGAAVSAKSGPAETVKSELALVTLPAWSAILTCRVWSPLAKGVARVAVAPVGKRVKAVVISPPSRVARKELWFTPAVASL